jgi:hypothetical protein
MNAPLPYNPVAPGPGYERQPPMPQGMHTPHNGGFAGAPPRLRLVVSGRPCVTKDAMHGVAPKGTCWDEQSVTRPVAMGDADGAIVATSALAITLYALHVAGTAAGAYHGYKRTESVGWAVGWALLGGFVPYIVIPVAFAQGFGKKKVG